LRDFSRGLGQAIEEADLAMYLSKRDRSAVNNIREPASTL